MIKKMTVIPRINNSSSEEQTIEWQIPGRVSAAFMFTEATGYSFIAKVRVEKKHWWNRSWKTYITHSKNEEDAFRKGLKFLESHDYQIDAESSIHDKFR